MPDLSITGLTLRLAQLSRELDQAQRDLAGAETEAVRARNRADLAEAKAFLAAEGSVDARKRTALLDSAGFLLDAELAYAGRKAAASHLDVLRTQIDVGRSLLSAARAELGLLGHEGAA